MKMMKDIFYGVLFSVILVMGGAACTKHSDTEGAPIAFSTELLSSRATDAEGNTKFENGDLMSVFAFHHPGGNTAVANEFMVNQDLVMKGGEWVYEPVKYWPAGADDKLSFYGFYPYTKTSSSDNEAYDEATGKLTWEIDGRTDVLYAESAGLSKTSSVRLDYIHRLKRFKFRFLRGAGFGDGLNVDKIEVKNSYGTVSFDMASKSFALAGAGTVALAGSFPIVSKPNPDNTSVGLCPEALILDIPAGEPLIISLTANGVVYPDVDVTLAPGDSFLLTLTFGGVGVAIDADITDWNDMVHTSETTLK